MSRGVLLILVALFLVAPAVSWGQQGGDQSIVKDLLTQAERMPRSDSSSAQTPPTSEVSGFYDLRLVQERNRIIAVIVLAVVALIAHVIVLKYITAGGSYSASHVVNATGLVFIIFGTIILVMLVDTDQQLAAATGVLGAVAGYLFGAISRTGGGARGAPER